MSFDSHVGPLGRGSDIELTSSMGKQEADGTRNRLVANSLSGGVGIARSLSFSFDPMDELNGKGKDISYTAEFFKGCLKLAGLVIAVPGLILYVVTERLGSGMHYVSQALERHQNTKENINNVTFDTPFLSHSKTKSITSKIVQGVLFLNPISAGLRASIGALAVLGAGAMRFGLGDENFKAVIGKVDGSWGYESSFKGVANRIGASLDDIKRAYTPEAGSPFSSRQNSNEEDGQDF